MEPITGVKSIMQNYELKRIDGVRCLVIGGLGFIGSNAAQKLSGLGAEITIYDACLDPFGWNFENIAEISGSAKFVKGDIRDLHLLEKTVSECEPNLVFNCAGQVSHVDSMSDPWLDIDINCTGNINVLEALRRKAPGSKIIYAGTRAQIGRLVYSPIDESHPTDPTDIYGINKLAAEKYHLLYNDVYGLRACSVRLNNCYGPRHQMKHGKYGILNWFLRRAMKNEQIDVYGTGEQTRDYNYVEDAVDALILCAQSAKADGEVFLLGSGSEIKFIDMVKKVIETAGRGSYQQIEWPQERKAIEVGNFFVTFEKISKALGWHPTTPFEEGLAKTVEWYRENNRLEKYA